MIFTVFAVSSSVDITNTQGKMTSVGVKSTGVVQSNRQDLMRKTSRLEVPEARYGHLSFSSNQTFIASNQSQSHLKREHHDRLKKSKAVSAAAPDHNDPHCETWTSPANAPLTETEQCFSHHPFQALLGVEVGAATIFGGDIIEREKCNGRTYGCSSQAHAEARCNETDHMVLCSKEQILDAPPKHCAFMWTSSDHERGMYKGIGTSGCGSRGVLHETYAGWNGRGMFDAACCLSVEPPPVAATVLSLDEKDGGEQEYIAAAKFGRYIKMVKFELAVKNEEPCLKLVGAPKYKESSTHLENALEQPGGGGAMEAAYNSGVPGHHELTSVVLVTCSTEPETPFEEEVEEEQR